MLEGPTADIAFVRSFLGVNPAMNAEVFLHGERLVAVLALEGFFTCMGPVMTG